MPALLRLVTLPLFSLLLSLGTLGSFTRAHAASTASGPHVRVDLVLEHTAIAPGQASSAAVRFQLEEGWHLYWQNPGDSGEAPRVTFTLPAGLHAGTLLFPVPHRVPTGPLVNYGYEGGTTLLSELRAGEGATEGSFPVRAEVKWLVCSEVCIPGKAQLDATLAVQPETKSDAAVAPVFADARAALPRPAPSGLRLTAELDAQSFLLTALTDLRPQQASFFPLDADLIDNPSTQTLTPTGAGFTLRALRSEQLLDDKGVTRLRGLLVLSPLPAGEPPGYLVDVPVFVTAAPAKAPSVPGATIRSADAPASAAPGPAAASTAPAPAAPLSLGSVLLLALLGGALLNLMPCVFPVLSIKALGLIQLGAAERRHAARHALAYSAGILVSFWVLAGTLIVLRLLGQQLGWGFQLQSPRFLIALAALLFLLGLNLLGIFEIGIGLTGVGQSVTSRSGYAGSFGTGVLATVLATPCTAPFMGTAIGFAMSQPPASSLLTFTALGLGLALPYLLLIAAPGLLRFLPRPGAWMDTFKQLMGFMLLGTVVWLSFVLGVQSGPEGVTALLAGLLVIGIGAWVLHRFGERRAATALAVVLILTGALGPGWLAHTQDAAATPAPGSAATPGDDLAWEPFSPERVEQYRRAGKPVFIDFTAAWCVSCKVNERFVLRTQEVRERFKSLGVIPIKADWTSSDPAITQALAALGRSGVPCYVLYGRDPAAPGLTLPEVLSTGIVLRALDTLKQ